MQVSERRWVLCASVEGFGTSCWDVRWDQFVVWRVAWPPFYAGWHCWLGEKLFTWPTTGFFHRDVRVHPTSHTHQDTQMCSHASQSLQLTRSPALSFGFSQMSRKFLTPPFSVSLLPSALQSSPIWFYFHSILPRLAEHCYTFIHNFRAILNLPTPCKLSHFLPLNS